MPVDIATVVITAPVPYVVDFLVRPGNVRRYLSGVVPGEPAPRRAVDPPALGGRWAFAADPSAHKFRWWLLAPYRAAGTLDVYGDCTVSQLWVTVQSAPRTMPAADVHDAVRAVLHRLRRCVEGDLARQAARHAAEPTPPVLLRTA